MDDIQDVTHFFDFLVQYLKLGIIIGDVAVSLSVVVTTSPSFLVCLKVPGLRDYGVNVEETEVNRKLVNQLSDVLCVT